MTVKPKRESIRTATPPGVKTSVATPRPEQPVDADGTGMEIPPSYQELSEYHAAADEKLAAFVTLANNVGSLLNQGKVDEAEAAIASFDRSIPTLEQR